MDSALDRARGELGAALAQEAPSDDKIIMNHVRKALTILEEMDAAMGPDDIGGNLRRIADTLENLPIAIEGAIYNGIVAGNR